MATAKIGGSIALEGASKYNADLKEIKSNLAVLRSEMKLANAANTETANSTEALAKKNEILNKQIEQTSKKVETYGKMFDDAEKSQKKAAENVDKYGKELEEAKKALDDMKKSGDATDKELEEQEKIVSKLEKELTKSEKAYAASSQKMNQYKTASNNAETELKQLDSELQKNEKYLDEAKHSADGTAKSIDKFGDEIIETKEQISAFGEIVRGNIASDIIVQGVKMLARGIKDVATAAMDMGMEFESSMAQVAAISGATGDDLTALSDKAKEMGATSIFSATESAQALSYMAMAGWKTEDMLSGLEGIMNLAAASGESLAATSDIVTDALTAFGLSAEDSGHFADVLAQASSNANTNVGMMGETFKYCAPVAGALSMSVEDVAVGIGLMANAGIKASQAGTSLRRILLEMGGDIEISSDAMGDMVVNTTNADGTMRSFSDIIVDLRTAFNGLSEAEKKSNAQAIVGKNAVSGFLAILNASQADFDKLTESIENADGAAMRMAAIMNDNLKGDLIIMNSALEGLGIAFEDCFDDSARTAVQGATEVIGQLKADIESGDMGVSLRRMGDAFQDLSERTLEFAMDALPSVIDGLTWLMDNSETVTSLVAGMITAQLATKTVTPIVMECQAAYTALTTAEEGAAVAQGVLNAAMNANPIGLIVTALGFAVGAIATYSALAGNAADETSSLCKSTDDLAQSLDNSARRRAENAENMRNEAALASSLKGELEKLQSKTSLTVEEQIRQKEIVSELNSIMPDLNLAIDDQTGKLDEHSQAVLKDVDALMQQYMAQAAQKDLAEISDELFQAEKNRLEVSKQLNDAVKELKESEAEYREETAAGNDQAVVTAENIVRQREEVERLEDALHKAGENVSEQKERFAEADEIVKQYTDTSEEAAVAQDNMAASSEDAASSIESVSKEIEEANEKLQQSVESTVNNINPLFTELATTSETTLSQVSENLAKNAEAAAKFAETLESATASSQYGTDEAFTQIVNTLAEKGPEATELLAQVVEGARNNTEEYQTLISNMSEFMTGENSVSKAVSDLTTEVETGLSDTSAAITEKEGEITTTLQTEGEAQAEVVQKTSDDIKEIAGKAPKDAASAVTASAPEVTTAAKEAAEGAYKAASSTIGYNGSSSSVFLKMGSATMKSFADGVKSEESTVRTALQTVIQNAIDTMDISGLASRIDKALGSALNG